MGLEEVEPHVDQTSGLIPTIRVGCGVIAARCSENTNQRRVWLGRIGNRNITESWVNLKWKKFRQDLFRLQKRVFKAVQVGDKRKAWSLQKLILKSRAARLLAIRQVTQLNAGKKTAGIDGKKSLSFEERFALELTLKSQYNNWHHGGLREIPIPKKDGTTRMLKIPTIADRCWQCLAKYALEPAHEPYFLGRGEIHCGTNTRRQPFTQKWWKVEPAFLKNFSF